MMMNENQIVVYNDVIDKLMVAEYPELMLRELIAERGKPFITEDMISLIERREREEANIMMDYALANPDTDTTDFPRYLKNTNKLKLIKVLFWVIGDELI